MFFIVYDAPYGIADQFARFGDGYLLFFINIYLFFFCPMQRKDTTFVAPPTRVFWIARLLGEIRRLKRLLMFLQSVMKQSKSFPTHPPSPSPHSTSFESGQVSEHDRAEILHSFWVILCTTFGKKKLTGSCQVTEL